MEINDIKQIVRNELVTSILESQEFFIVGNWKMNKTKDEVNVFLDDIVKHDFGNKNTVVIMPPLSISSSELTELLHAVESAIRETTEYPVSQPPNSLVSQHHQRQEVISDLSRYNNRLRPLCHLLSERMVQVRTSLVEAIETSERFGCPWQQMLLP